MANSNTNLVDLVLDTSAYSELRRGNKDFITLVKKTRYIFVPMFVVAELAFGFKNGSKYKENHLELEKFLSNPYVNVMYIDNPDVIQRYSDLKLLCKQKGRALSDHDIWIASLALLNEYHLATCDKDFEILRETMQDRLHILRSDS